MYRDGAEKQFSTQHDKKISTRVTLDTRDYVPT